MKEINPTKVHLYYGKEMTPTEFAKTTLAARGEGAFYRWRDDVDESVYTCAEYERISKRIIDALEKQHLRLRRFFGI
jgi:hypothetical protein